MDVAELVPLKEVRRLLAISNVTLWRWAKQGKISIVKPSARKACVRDEELKRFIQDSEIGQIPGMAERVIHQGDDANHSSKHEDKVTPTLGHRGSAEKRFSFPAKVPDDGRMDLKHRIGSLLSRYKDGAEFALTASALALYDEWYMNLERSLHARRLDTYALRLMILLTVNSLEDEVDENVVKQALPLQLAIRSTEAARPDRRR